MQLNKERPDAKRRQPPTTTAAQQKPKRLRDERQQRMAQNFSSVIAVLMRDAHFKNLKLADLETLVLPPVMAGQFEIGFMASDPGPGKKQGRTATPAVVALWASVSPEIDKRLSASADPKQGLRMNEWASGDQLWLVALAGDQRLLPGFVKQLEKTDFKGRNVKMRVQAADGSVSICNVGAPQNPHQDESWDTDQVSGH